jgi:hypothetical protein
MEEPSEGDWVRIDIPDETDVGHQYHGQYGHIVTTVVDNAKLLTGDPANNTHLPHHHKIATVGAYVVSDLRK